MKTKYPLLKFSFFLSVGFLTNYLFNFSTLILLIFSCTVLLLAIFSKFSNTLKFTLISVSIGFLLQSSVSLYNFKEFDNTIANSFEGVFKGKVLEILSSKENKTRFIAEGIIQSKIFKKKYHSIVIFTAFSKNHKLDINPGANFLANSDFRLGQPKILKEDFNEKTYLISKKAYFYGTIFNNNIAIKHTDFNLSNILHKIRRVIKKRINEIVPDKEIANIMIALTTGDKSGISRDTQNNFSITGTAHILAISGLHVGIFSIFILVLIGFINNRTTKIVIFITTIWLFALLTGGQPSTIRAVIMATVASYFIYYGKYPNPVNILLFTFIVYIMIQPTILYSISFQLSFLSVAGIILLYNPIYDFFKMTFVKDNTLTKFIASSFAISFAATLTTSFLTAYYFNSFSYVYPLSNISVLFLMTFATVQSILFVLFSFISLPLASLFAKSAFIGIDLSIKINEYFAKIGGYRFNGEELLIISIITSVILIYIFYSKSFHQLGFRLMVSILAAYLFLNMKLVTTNSMIIIPREHFTSLILSNQNIENILISDRNKQYKLSFDNALIDHIKNSNKNIKIYMTGNNSINLNDQVKYLKNVKSDFISISKLDSITNQLNLKPLYTITKNYD